MALEIDFLMSYDKESIKAELRRIAKVTGKQNLTRDTINQYGRVTAHTVMNKFGSLYEAHKAAGLVPGVFKMATDRDLLKILVELWTMTQKKFGRSPTMPEVRRYGFPSTGQTIAKRFGTWNAALMAASRMASASPGAKKGTATRVGAKEKPKRKRGMISARKRFLVFRRDKYTCRICKRVGGELQVDHVIPFSRGGSDNMENLQTLCRKCNIGKGGNLE